jgi:hypothetical protein
MKFLKCRWAAPTVPTTRDIGLPSTQTMNDFVMTQFHSSKPLVVLGCAIALLLLSGCDDNPLGRQAIDGTVTLDGAPLSHGNIRFEPKTPGDSTAAGAVIAAGRFDIERQQGLPPGDYRVSISSPTYLATANRSDDEGGLAEELVPARYNRETTLEVTVTSAGNNQFSFDLRNE